MGLLSLLLVSMFSACERMSGVKTFAFAGISGDADKASEGNSENEQEVQAALREDAQLAQKMPLKQFARYMKSRHAYYKDYHTQYQDDYVKITLNGSKMRIETGKGKVKMEYTEDVAKARAE